MTRTLLEPLETRVGQARHGDNQFFGHSVGKQLAGEETVTGLIALSVSGRRLTPDERAVLDDVAVVMTVADPRIWPLKLTRVLSAYGSALPALAAANLCIERAHIGHFTTGIAAENLAELSATVEDPADREAVGDSVLAMLARGGRFMGFGVPFRPLDERVESLRTCLARRGRTGLGHWTLFESLASVMLEKKGLRPNIGLAVAAACLDLGFGPRQISLLAVALGQTDYLANVVEGAAQAPDVLRELPAHTVRYVGPAPRKSPRALGEASSEQTRGR